MGPSLFSKKKKYNLQLRTSDYKSGSHQMPRSLCTKIPSRSRKEEDKDSTMGHVQTQNNGPYILSSRTKWREEKGPQADSHKCILDSPDFFSSRTKKEKKRDSLMGVH